jgi:hypothetical protein
VETPDGKRNGRPVRSPRQRLLCGGCFSLNQHRIDIEFAVNGTLASPERQSRDPRPIRELAADQLATHASKSFFGAAVLLRDDSAHGHVSPLADLIVQAMGSTSRPRNAPSASRRVRYFVAGIALRHEFESRSTLFHTLALRRLVPRGADLGNALAQALAADPGVLVDRVTKLGSGAYNVHCIGVNWPHHIFDDQDFEAVGAN